MLVNMYICTYIRTCMCPCTYVCMYTIYYKSFEVEKFRRFCRSIGKRETFTVKHFQLVLKMVYHGPESSLKNSCDLLSALCKVSRIMLPSQNY